MDRGLEKALEESLDLLAQGVSLDACLARYPDKAEELTPALTLAQAIQGLAPFQPLSAPKLAQGRRMFLQEAARLREERPARQGWLVTHSFPARAGSAAAGVLLLAMVLGGGAVLAAGGDLRETLINLVPQPLQDVLNLEQEYATPTPVVSEEPEETFGPEEADENEQGEEVPPLVPTPVVSEEPEETVEPEGEEQEETHGTGVIDEVGENFVVITGITIYLGPDTEVEGTLVAGEWAEWSAEPQSDDTLLATEITVAEDEDDGGGESGGDSGSNSGSNTGSGSGD